MSGSWIDTPANNGVGSGTAYHSGTSLVSTGNEGSSPCGSYRPAGVAKVSKAMQQYNLYPNPSDGNIYLQQATMDDKPVNVEVWNATGDVVYKQQLQFSNNVTALNLKGKLSTGIYMLRLSDSKGQSYVLKFIVTE
jgi:Secretion system C-terminal sorting domain